MADPIPYPDTNDDTGVRPSLRSTTSTPPSAPRWVKVIGITLLVLVLLLVVMMLSGGGHGPGRHMSSSITEYGVQALAWGIG